MSNPEAIVESNLSYAWAQAFLRAMGPGKVTGHPLLLSVIDLHSGEPLQNSAIRTALDGVLYAMNKTSVDDSAYTIFPFSMWNVRNPRPTRDWVFERYLHNLPRIKARNPLNRNGTYFERMIHFIGASESTEVKTINQLDHVIQVWQHADKREKGTSPRASALQVSCMDPAKDHTFQPRRGFPCLQQVSFTCDRENRLLTVNAYYPTQYVFDRGYGNYLGLCHLGLFMAHEMELQLDRLNCFIVTAELGDVTKTQLRELETICKSVLATTPSVQ